MSDLVERVARAWASMDGNSEAFDACKADPAREAIEGRYQGYMADAAELISRAGIDAWMPIETPPEIGLPVLVCSEGDHINTASLNEWGWWVPNVDGCDVEQIYGVTGWMPLPEQNENRTGK